MKTRRTIRWTLLLASVVSTHVSAAQLTLTIEDAQSGEPLPARIYIEDNKGHWHFVKSKSDAGSAVIYNKVNWLQAESFE